MSDDFFADVPAVRTSASNTSKALEIRHDEPPAVQTARLLYESGLFPNARNVGGVFTIVQYGKEVGLSPVVALNSVAIINGKLSMSGASMLALAMKHGVKATFEEETNQKCSILFERDGYQPYHSSFTIEDAEQAELLRKEGGRIKHEGWRKYPNQMLRWRAISKGLKVIAPDILAGVYTEEEIESLDSAQRADHGHSVPEEPVREQPTQKDQPTRMTQQGAPPPVGKMTAGQRKALHSMMTQRGVTPFREQFKNFLLSFEGNGMNPDNPSANDINKEFCSDLIGKFKSYATQFFANKKYRQDVERIFKGMAEQNKTSFLRSLKTLLDDAEFFNVPDAGNAQRIEDFFHLVLIGIENQEHNRIANAAQKNGMSVEETVDVLEDMGLDPEIIT